MQADDTWKLEGLVDPSLIGLVRWKTSNRLGPVKELERIAGVSQLRKESKPIGSCRGFWKVNAK